MKIKGLILIGLALSCFFLFSMLQVAHASGEIKGEKSINEIFEDGNLALIIAGKLNKSIVDDVTQAELNTIMQFDAEYCDIKSISGVEFLKNLASVNLNSNKIVDLSPLKDLKELKVLNLNNNIIKQLKPLSNIRTLRVLELNENIISDVDSLKNLSELRILLVNSNKIVDISCVGNMQKLFVLEANNNSITNMQPIMKRKEATYSAQNQTLYKQPVTVNPNNSFQMLNPVVVGVCERNPENLAPKEISVGGQYDFPDITWKNLASKPETIECSYSYGDKYNLKIIQPLNYKSVAKSNIKKQTKK